MTLPKALQHALTGPQPMTIALSGGVDSLTLSAAACVVRGHLNVTLCHAVSPAVPTAATERVHRFAASHDVELRVVDAGEFADEAYRANPVNRCYFCKANLYDTLSCMGDVVASGTNLDDLADFRPGLKAAQEHNVFHPFVDAKMTKTMVRALARELGLGDLADLPAAPCLASRVETGLRVEPDALRLIDKIESLLRDRLGNITLRCRQLHAGWMIEIDQMVFDAMTMAQQTALREFASEAMGGLPVGLRGYSRGSAFAHG